MKNIKRLLALIMTLVMMVGLLPSTIYTPAYAYPTSATHSLADGLTFGGNSDQFKNKYSNKTGRMASINYHLLDGSEAYCIEPAVGDTNNSSDGYSFTGDGEDSTLNYWNNTLDENARTAIAAILEYSDTHAPSYNSGMGKSDDWVRHIGTQLAIFETLINKDSGNTNLHNERILEDKCWRTGYHDVVDYAEAAMSYAASKSVPDLSISVPTCNERTVELTYNTSNGEYEGSISGGAAVTNEGYDFNSCMSGVSVSQSGNTIYISATPAAAANLSTADYVASASVTKSAYMDVNLAAVKIYSGGSGNQPMVTYEYEPFSPGYVSNSETCWIKAHATAVLGEFKLVKNSTDTSITDGNACYSLSGAQYAIYSSYADAQNRRNAVETVSTSASGVSNVVELVIGNYWVREVSPSQGYTIDDDIYGPVEIIANETTSISVYERPTNDPVPIVLRKRDDKTSTPGYTSGKMSLEGAQYTFKFYPAQYSSVEAAEASGGPLRTWVVKTNANGIADIRREESLVAGSDALYHDSAGTVSFPLGTIVVYESLAPTGYLIDNTKYLINITESGASSTIINTTNEAVVPETPIMGGITVVKQDSATGSTAQGTATLNGNSVFEIVNNSGKTVTVNGTDYSNGQVCLTMNTVNGAAASGKVLPYGDYILREGTAPTGYNKNTDYSVSFSITSDNQVVTAPTCTEVVMKGAIKIAKSDSELSNGAQGSATLSGAVFSIYSASGNGPVVIDGQTYNAGDFIMDVPTESNGQVTTAPVFPYGRYVVKEKTPPTGYTLNSAWSSTGVTVNVSPTSDGQVFAAGICANDVLRGNISVTKVDADHSSSPQGNATFEGAVFEVYNASTNPVVVDDHEYGQNEVVLTITADESGVAKSTGNKLPYGSYYIKEKTSPAGYALNSTWTSETVSITSAGATVSAGNCEDPVLRGRLHVQKKDAGLDTTTPYGDASFAGVKFNIYNASAHDVVVNGETYAPGDFITDITALANGVATLDENILPYGKYRVTEAYADPTKGYAVNDSYEGFAEITAANQNAAVDVDCEDEGNIFGYIEVHKYDSDNANADPQGDASLEGATFKVTNKSANAVIVDGTTYAPDALIGTFDTDASGVATFTKALPMGTYLVEEDQNNPSTGYNPNATWSQTVQIRTDGETIVLENTKACLEPIIKGGLSVQKYDKAKLEETGDYAQSMEGPGGMKLENAEITIINRSENGIWYDGHFIPPYSGDFVSDNRTALGIVTRIYTNNAGLASTGEHDLPYGTYELHETDAPSGYLLNDEWTKTVQIREDGVIAEVKEADGVVDELCRTNIFFNKEGVIGSTHKRLGLVAFRLTNNDTGESHIIVTDLNGTFDSSTYLHSQNTNGNDAAVDADGNVNADLLDYEAGVWFGGGTVLDTLPDGTPVGAFPYSKTGYSLEELRTPASSSHIGTGNAGWDLMDGWTVYIPKRLTADAYFIGTVTDTRPEGIRTKLTDKSSGEHQAEASNNVILIDNVVYTGLVVGKTYTIRGYLVDASTGAKVLIDGNEVTCEKSFTPSSPNDSDGEPVQFVFDASTLAGKTVVAYEFLYNGTDLIATHEDLDSEAQTVSFPAISTSAHNAAGQREFDASGAVDFVDTVYYENLEPGITYELTATLMDKATSNPLKDASNNVVKTTYEFKPSTRSGSVDVPFSLSGNILAGKQIVVFEVLKIRGTTIARHEEINDGDQTLSFPKIATVLVGEGGIHSAKANTSITLTDTVSYSGVTIGSEYTITGTLMDKESNSELLDNMGAPITTSKSFTAETASGSIDLTFTFDASSLAGSSVVAFEEMSNSIGIVAEHKDINDADQTVVFPSVSTSAADKDGNKDIYASGTIKIVDEISYRNLVPGTTYKASGVLMDKSTSSPLLDKNGNEVTAEASFKPDSADGSVNVTFSFSASDDLEGKNVVVFETIKQETIVICAHKDIDDEDQTVHFPKIRTTATVNDSHEALAADGITLVDRVHYEGLIPGEVYKLSGVVVQKGTNLLGQPVGKAVHNNDGEEVRAEVEFTPDASNGDIELAFLLDAANLKGGKVIVFETLTHEDRVVAKHEDLNDEDQTVTFPKITTNLVDENNMHMTNPSGEITLNDTVSYEGLNPDTAYTITGVLMYKDTNSVVKNDDDTVVTSEQTFTPSASSGTVELTFTVDASKINLENKTVVAFEELSNAVSIIAEHKDINDEAQTVRFPKLTTYAHDKGRNKDIYASGDIVVFDDVYYYNLVQGEQYKLSGILMDRDSGEPLLDKNGHLITREKSFRAEVDGMVEVKFSFAAADDLAGKTAVIFETLYHGDTVMFVDDDLDNDAETVYFPRIATTATISGQHEALAQDGIELVDSVVYENLIPEHEYILSGVVVERKIKLLGQEVGNPIKDENGDEIRVEKTFVADRNGTVEITFNLDAAKYEGKNLIVFEELRAKSDDHIVATHEDLNDADQTVRFPSISTSATAEDGSKHVFLSDDGEHYVIVDTVNYKNLIPGETYKMSGVLRDKETAGVVKDAQNTAINVEVEFSPTAAEGSMQMRFEVPTGNVEGRQIVVFESLMSNGMVVAKHEDINDEDQTVDITWREKIYKFDASSHEGLAGAVFEITDITPGAQNLAKQTITSDEEGYVYFNGLPEHTYKVVEKKTPEGYYANGTTEYSVKIEADGTLTGAIEIANVHGGTVIITKTDIVTGDPVADCEVTVYKVTQVDGKEQREQVFQQKTDARGRIYFYTAEPGKYVYKETQTCYGYYLNEDEFTFEIATDLTVKGTVHFTNVPFGTAVIKKTDKSGNPLKGAEIAVYSEDGKLLGKGVSAENGRVYFVSPGPGKYYFVETKAPQGYNKVDTKQYFVIGSDYTITGTLTLKNERTPSNGKTGDATGIWLWVAAASVGVAGAGTAMFFILKKKKEESKAE